MTKGGRPPYDLLREWLLNDHPMTHFGMEVVRLGRDVNGDYGGGLRGLVLDVRSTVRLPKESDQNAYAQLCRALHKDTNFPAGPVIKVNYTRWVMDQMSDLEFNSVDWTALAYDVFDPEES